MSADMVKLANINPTSQESIPANITEELKFFLIEKFKPGQKFLDENDLCQQFKVNLADARRIQFELIKEGFLSYNQNNELIVTPESVESEAKLVSIFVSEPIKQSAWSIYQQTISAIRQKYQSLPIQIIQANLNYNFQEAFRQSRQLLEQKIDGIIFQCISSEYEYTKNKELIEIFERQKIPVVLIDKYFINEPENYSYVVSDNENGGFIAAQHLLKLGYQRIAFIRDVFSSSVIQREQGYRKALFQAGIRCDENLIKIFFDLPQLLSRLDELFKHNQTPPEAVIAINDWIASEIYAYLARIGLRIPRDVAVVAFDDLPHARRLKPPLTTVHQDFILMGQMAASFLLRRMKAFTQLPHLILPCQLIVRESCGAHRRPQKIRGTRLKSVSQAMTSPVPTSKLKAPVLTSKPKEIAKIGLLFRGFPEEPYLSMHYSKIIKALEESTPAQDYQPVISKTFNTKIGEYGAIKQLVRANIKGLLFVATHDELPPSQEELVFLFRRNIPFVLLTHCEITVMPCISVDDRYGGFIAAERLIRDGRKSIAAILSKAGELAGDLRLRGFYDAIDRYNFNTSNFADFRDVLKVGSRFFESAYNWARNFNFQQYPIDGLICYNDDVARGAMKALMERRLAVPDDIAIIGFDDINVTITDEIALTTVHVPYNKIGQEAIKQLIHQIKNHESTGKILVKPQLIIRKSG